MPVKKDSSGRRFIELEIDLPATPEKVWQAIATGPGISSWFVPTEVEERKGGKVVFHLGPEMDSSGHVTAWEPPYRFAYEEPGWSDKAPPLATEIIIEARDGGLCRMRLVHSLFTDSDDWDGELESMEAGWPPFFAVLRLYLEHFAGMPAASVRPTGEHAGILDEAWKELTAELGLSGAATGERHRTPEGAPRLTGTVERICKAARNREIMLRLDEPAPGVALVGAYEWGGKVQVAVSLYFYGDDAATTAAREEATWQDWIGRRFPPRSRAAQVAG
jgi:uncharacterized protein YndB with AHSA1/START domain